MPYRHTSLDEPLAQEDLDGLSCCLCARPRQEVTQLVQGLSGCVCTDCLHHALTALKPSPDPIASAQTALDQALASLTPSSPYAVTHALVHACLALWRDDPFGCRRIAAESARARYSRGTLDALARIPQERWTSSDRIAISYAAWSVGEYELGLDALDGGVWDAVEDGVLRIINRVALQLEVGGDDLDLRCAREDLAHARRILSDAPSPSERSVAQYRATMDMNLGECALLAGDPNKARESLAHAVRTAPVQIPWQHVRLGDALAALGDEAGARAEWERGLDAAHPESRVASAARSRLAR